MDWTYVIIDCCLIGAVIYLRLYRRKKDKEWEEKEEKYWRERKREDEEINHLLKRFRLLTRYNMDADFGEWFRNRWK